MSENEFSDFVFSLDKDQFSNLKKAVETRIDKDLYGVTSFEEAASLYERKPVCPKCSSTSFHEDGFTPAGYKRYRCDDCNNSYTLLSDSIFNSAKISFHKLMGYISLMSFNVPLEMCCEILDISANTAELWRKKIFETVNGYQDHLKLYGTIWIDETYMEDYSILHDQFSSRKRGLSRDLICIVTAIDSYKNMVAIISGHGKPSSKRIKDALKSHITLGCHIIHDGDRSHNALIRETGCISEVYKANTKDPNYIRHMALINNMHGWLKRYLWRFIGMDVVNLQSYLNWFIYLKDAREIMSSGPKQQGYCVIWYLQMQDLPVNTDISNHTIVDYP